jgi:HEAT repeat protein
MLRCRDADPEVIAPLAESQDKRLRAAAIAALAKHGGDEAAEWFERGLKDPEPCVRAETAALLSEIDLARHREIFELAFYDPNPEIRRRARDAAERKGYPAEWYRWPEAAR